jgi:hypothetical protein
MNKWITEWGFYLFGSGLESTSDFFDYGNNSSSSERSEEFFHKINDYWFLKKDFAPWV